MEDDTPIEATEINKSLLDKPVVCLLLDSEPIAPFSPQNGLSPEEVRMRAHLRPVFTPLLITDNDLSYHAFENLELVDSYGPFRVYRPEGTIYEPARTYKDRESFRDSRKNLANWCHLPEMDIPLTTKAQEEVEGKTDEAQVPEVKIALPPGETRILRNQLADMLDQEVIARVETAPSLVQYPSALLEGLSSLVTQLSLPGVHSTLRDFSAHNLEPLRSFAAKEVARLGKLGNDHPEEVFESVVGIEGFDIVLEMLKSQSELLIETKNELSHKGVMIPFKKFEGEPSYSPNAFLEIKDGELVIKSKGNEYRFPLPAKHGAFEVCFKGGLARIVAKIALGEDISGELPVKDVDLAVFGKGELSLKEIAKKYKTNAREIERLEDGSYESYCATRDSTFNEVLVSPEGVFISFNALSSMYQGYTQAGDDNTSESLFNKHLFSVYKPDLITGKEKASDQFVYIGKERFPSPVALSRMFKLLIDGKCDGIVVPEGIRKTDVGIYWLVMARKILAEENSAVKEAKMERMLTLANFVDSPFYTSLPENQKHNPEAFLERLKAAYPNFDMEGSLSDKDTILWIVQKLRNQIVRAYMNSIGQSEEKSLQKKLEADDLDLEVITLPPMEAYGIDGEKKKEMDLREKEKVQEAREIMEVFDSFSIEPNEQLIKDEAQIRAIILDLYKDTGIPPTNLGRLYYIPVEKRQDFLRLLQTAGISGDPKVMGGSFSVHDTSISYIFLDKVQHPLMAYLSIFEELYHASGLKITDDKFIAGSRIRRQGYGVSRITKEGVLQTSLLEEGIAGLEWKYYKQQQMIAHSKIGQQLEQGIELAKGTNLINSKGNVQFIVNNRVVESPADYVTFIPNGQRDGQKPYFSSYSSHASSLIEIIVNDCGGESMLNLMREARRGDVTSMREVAKRIDHQFGQGSYGLLLKTSADNEEETERLKMKFSQQPKQ